MITLKIKYTTTEDGLNLIKEYRKQYSSVLHFAYNRRYEGVSEKDIENQISSLNNIPLIKSYLKRCAVKHATQLIKTDDRKRIFGGKKNFIDRCKGKIDRDEFLNKRLSNLYIIGEANQLGNRMVVINDDLKSFTFKPTRKDRIVLSIDGRYKRYKSTINKLYHLQQDKGIAITYELDSEYIYITYDEATLEKCIDYKPIKNRIFAIDLNPNYVGWSVVDWKNSGVFEVVKSGVISIKDINDIDFGLKGKSSESKERIHINNKRIFETYEISKLLVNTAKYYRCEVFGLEKLNIKSKDTTLGKNFNKLVNNVWNRNKLVNNIKKRCNVYNIKVMLAKPNYSSFVGNFLFRDLNLPDMTLASIEIGRRCYEFKTQYIDKKYKKKNIILPDVNDFNDRYIKSLEEFNIPGEIKDLIGVYNFLKKSKSRYRLSLDGLSHLEFSRCFSNKSKIKKILITLHKNL
jgi:hypothetical protein